MEKIFIVGIVASGKTTLAKRLSNQLIIPWYELDCVVHYEKNGVRITRTPEEQVEFIADINKTGKWIFEGTDRKSYECLYDLADTVVFLDPPLWKRRVRIFTRYIKTKLKMYKNKVKRISDNKTSEFLRINHSN